MRILQRSFIPQSKIKNLSLSVHSHPSKIVFFSLFFRFFSFFFLINLFWNLINYIDGKYETFFRILFSFFSVYIFKGWDVLFRMNFSYSIREVNYWKFLGIIKNHYFLTVWFWEFCGIAVLLLTSHRLLKLINSILNHKLSSHSLDLFIFW